MLRRRLRAVQRRFKRRRAGVVRAAVSRPRAALPRHGQRAGSRTIVAHVVLLPRDIAALFLVVTASVVSVADGAVLCASSALTARVVRRRAAPQSKQQRSEERSMAFFTYNLYSAWKSLYHPVLS